MNQNLKIALAQINPIVGDLNYNTDKIVRYWKEAEARKADLIVFSELVLCGYPPEDLIFKSVFLDEIEKRIEKLVRGSTDMNCGLLISAPYRVPSSKGKAHAEVSHEEQIHDATFLIHAGKIQAITLKHHLASYGVFDEDRLFIPGPMPTPVNFKGVRLGILICEDLWHGKVDLHLKEQGAEILIVPNGSPYTIGKHELRLERARRSAQKTGLPVLYVNQVGGQDELVFDGGSFAMDANGEIVEQLPFFVEAMEVGGEKWEARDNSRPTSHLPPLASIYSALTLGLRDYVLKNRFPGVILGLSGGIDSALAAAIAVDALGAEKVLGVRLPSRYTSEESMEDAQDLADRLGIALETISIEKPLKAFEQTIPDLSGLAHENIQSRIRGTILMALSNMHGHMVLSTGNKSELAVGYATLYGDMNGGFNALKDIYKTQVYDLARWRNAEEPVIPERILTKIPTAELRENQTDQDSLPPYEVLDTILRGLVEEELSVEDIAAQGLERETALKVRHLLDRAEYKRYQACPGTKITTKAFGRDRRYPMTNGFILKS